MALKGRGLQFDDHDYKPEDYGRTDFAADRKKTNFEKGMDDLLFGGGPPPPRKPRQPKKEQPKKEEPKKSPSKKDQIIKQEPKPNRKESPKPSNIQGGGTQGYGYDSRKQAEKKKPNEQKRDEPRGNQSNIREKFDDSREIAKPKPKLNDSKESQKKGAHDTSQVSNDDRRKKPVINNYVEEREEHKSPPKQKKEEVVEQPRKHHREDIQEQQSKIQQQKAFNRPNYVKKLKKVAEDFKYDTENAERHSAFDVVRPAQCIRDIIKKENTPGFSDIEFPPDSVSIGFQHRAQWIDFKKPQQIYRAPVFGKYIDPNDIQPGSLSSPQFLSTLSCLAERQNNIKRLVQNQKINPNGFYFVRVNVNGVWRYVSVDDGLPEKDGVALGARSFNDSQADIWSSIIEKAYAKVYGGYNSFKRTVSRESYLRDLTGAPVRSYLMSDSGIANIINNALVQGYPVIAVPNSKISALGLNPNYSLSVLKCNSKGALELRNSWGTITERSNISLSKEGVFELSSSYTNDYISHIMIAYTDPQLCTSTIQSKHHYSFYSAYSFSVNNDTRGYISISQWDERLFTESKGYRYSPFRVILVKKTEEGQSVYVNAGFSHHSRNLDVQVNLTAGDYHVYCIGNWVDNHYDYNLTLSCYQVVQLKKVYYNNFPNIIAESLTNENIAAGKRSSKGNVDEYILYHEPTNLVLITAVSLNDKAQRYSQNMASVKFNELCLINTIHPEYTMGKKRRQQLDEYKASCASMKNWQIELLPHEKFTWVISNNAEYDPSNFKGWGFK